MIDARPFHPGIGQAVASRTILREGEDWGDVAERVALGNSLLHPTGAEDRESFRDELRRGTILMSGRHLQHGDADQPNRNLEVFTNCLDGGTKIATVDFGSQPIADLSGQTVLLIAADGQPRTAQIKSHGVQPLHDLSFRTAQNNGKIRHTVTATPTHRWLLADGSVTTKISVGDKLRVNPVDVTPDRDGIIHGLIFGDGAASAKRENNSKNTVSMGRSYAQIRVCDTGAYQTKIHDLLDEAGHSFSKPPHANGDRVYYLGKIPYVKELPFTYDPEYIAGFIEGWWLADGAKAPTLTCLEISTSRPEAVEWLQDYAGYAGYTVTSLRLVERKEGDGSYANGKPLHVIRLRRDVEWVLDSVEEAGEGEVFCPEEPVTGGFLLANGLVTGNCSTAAVSFALFYLLLNGSGVGRSYDDDMMLVDWDHSPTVRAVLDESHADFEWGRHESSKDARHKYRKGDRVIWFDVPDSREGWAQAIELYETLTFQKAYRDHLLVLDFSGVRAKGSPIGGMQDRPSSGPVPLMDALHKVGTIKGAGLPRWFQAMYVDHFLAEPVLVGGARRAARMSVKIWTDKSVIDFIRVKRPVEYEGLDMDEVIALRQSYFDRGETPPFAFLWSSNNSVGATKDFWRRLAQEPGNQGYNSELSRHAREVHKAVLEASYGDGTGEPGYVNLDELTQKDKGRESLSDGNYVGSAKYELADETKLLLAAVAKRASAKKYYTIVNPCGEIPIAIWGAYCVIADTVPYHAEDLVTALKAGELAARALIRTNLMDAFYKVETKRTNRIGVGQTGVHEFAWKFFGVGFRDLVNPDFEGYAAFASAYDHTTTDLEIVQYVLDNKMSDGVRAAAFWEWQGIYSRSTMRAAFAYADELGVERPHTVTTIKPAGTTSKLFGLTEGWHLPAMAWYLRWVQFRHDDPLVAKYEAQGYQVRHLKTYEGTAIVGFPTELAIGQLGMGDKLVLASEATPEEQYQWLKFGEFFWIEGGSVAEYLAGEGARPGEERHGGQISYTLKYDPNELSFEAFDKALTEHQSQVRACSVMPQTDASNSAYEYLPESPVDKATFEGMVRAISEVMAEDIGKEHIDCAGGSCPVDFNKKAA